MTSIPSRWTSLLPANATALEHVLASLSKQLEDITVDYQQVQSIDDAPESFLPFLAYAWSVDNWSDRWTTEEKRHAIRNSIWVHERKGTLGAVKRALEFIGCEGTITEWYQQTPKGTPGTFSVEVVADKGLLHEGQLQIRSIIDATKRLSAHYDLSFIIDIPAPACAYAAPLVGIEITIGNQ